VGSERDRAIAEAVREACASLCARVRCRTWDADECASQIRDNQQIDTDAIIAAVDAQHPAPPRLFDVWEGGYVHYTRPEGDPLLDEARQRPGYSVRPHVDPTQRPAPALPREVAMRIAEEVRASIFESADECASGWFIPEGPPSTTLAAIVSRHLPTDEEREAADAVVEAALAMRAAWSEAPISAYDRKRDTMHVMADRLLAIRAKRGAR